MNNFSVRGSVERKPLSALTGKIFITTYNDFPWSLIVSNVVLNCVTRYSIRWMAPSTKRSVSMAGFAPGLDRSVAGKYVAH